MSKKDKIRVLLIIFCEGESDNESSLTSTVAAIPGRNADAMIAKMRNGRVNRSNGLVGCILNQNGLIKNGIVGQIGLNIGFVGQVGLVSIVIRVGLNGIGLIGYSGLFGFISLSLIGFIGLSVVSLKRIVVLIFEFRCNPEARDPTAYSKLIVVCDWTKYPLSFEKITQYFVRENGCHPNKK
jgi:hypothetical protein